MVSIVDYNSNRHAVHLVVAHFIFCPKYRRAVLVGPVAARLRQIFRSVAKEKGWTIEGLAIRPDHVHLFVRSDPRTPLHKVVRAFKGRSSRLLRNEFRHLRSRLPSLWTRAYFVSTAGNVSQQTIKRYIEAQDVRRS
ncbi:MAG: IS200/IS605 family transposase [Deinococcus sp.]|nr:IS200/IS605 family transposase [Deinococcus sp.]